MNFKNKPTELFFRFLRKNLNTNKISLTEIAEKLDRYHSNPNALLHALSSGKSSITVEMILLAETHFGLDPCLLFKKIPEQDDEVVTAVNEDQLPINYVGVINNQLQQILQLQRKIFELEEHTNTHIISNNTNDNHDKS